MLNPKKPFDMTRWRFGPKFQLGKANPATIINYFPESRGLGWLSRTSIIRFNDQNCYLSPKCFSTYSSFICHVSIVSRGSSYKTFWFKERHVKLFNGVPAAYLAAELKRYSVAIAWYWKFYKCWVLWYCSQFILIRNCLIGWCSNSQFGDFVEKKSDEESFSW